MEFKKYTQEEFGRWCEEHMVEMEKLWEFIKGEEVNLSIVTDEDGDKSTLTVKVKLGTV